MSRSFYDIYAHGGYNFKSYHSQEENSHGIQN